MERYTVGLPNPSPASMASGGEPCKASRGAAVISIQVSLVIQTRAGENENDNQLSALYSIYRVFQEAASQCPEILICLGHTVPASGFGC